MSEGTLVPARLLVFRVGALACGVEVDRVREILPRLPTTRIPGAPPVVAGLVNIRGTLVTVVEGWRALGQPPPGPSAASPTSIADAAPGSTLVLDVAAGDDPNAGGGDEHKLVGFTVDEVMDIAGSETVLEDRQSLPGVDPTLVRAVGRRNEADGELFIVLDVAALLGPILTT